MYLGIAIEMMNPLCQLPNEMTHWESTNVDIAVNTTSGAHNNNVTVGNIH
jgi:hypothetical protein